MKAESPFVVRVHELSRTANDFEREHGRLCNQLRELLFRSFPAVLRMCPAADEPWIMGFVGESAFALEGGEVTSSPGRENIKGT